MGGYHWAVRECPEKKKEGCGRLPLRLSESVQRRRGRGVGGYHWAVSVQGRGRYVGGYHWAVRVSREEEGGMWEVTIELSECSEKKGGGYGR